MNLLQIKYVFSRMASLWFNCRKQPPLVGDHLILTFWVVAYGRFDCITYVASN